MNKQELIDKLNKQLTTPSEGTDFDYGHDYGIQRAIYLAEDLDEQQAPINKPEKPVVPQFVADWYEEHKEKLYTVEIPIANSPLGYHYALRKTISGEIIIDSFFTNNWGNYDYCQLTEEEIKKDHGWAWKYAKKVEE